MQQADQSKPFRFTPQYSPSRAESLGYINAKVTIGFVGRQQGYMLASAVNGPLSERPGLPNLYNNPVVIFHYPTENILLPSKKHQRSSAPK